MDPVLLGSLGASVALLVFVLWATSRHLFVLLAIAYVLFVPKIGLVSIPGTSVTLRGEDLLLGLILLRVALDLLAGKVVVPRAIRTIIGCFLLLVPVGIVGTVVGLQNGTVDSSAVATLFLLRRYEYAVFLLAGALYIGTRPSARLDLQRLLTAAVFFNTAAVLAQKAGLIGGLLVNSYVRNVSARPLGMFAGPYELAGFYALVLPLFVWQLFRSPRKFVPAAATASVFVAMVLSQSRVGLVSAVIIFVGMAAFMMRNKLLIFVGGVAALVATLVFAPTSSGSGDDRFNTLDLNQMWAATKVAYATRSYLNLDHFRVTSNIADQSFALRIDRWFNYYDGLFRFNPWFGLGPSAGGEAVDSNYLRILFEFGIVGIIALVILLFVVGRVIRRLDTGPWKAMAAWGGVGLLAQATFIDIFEASKVAEPFWLILGVAIALSAQKQDAGSIQSVETRSLLT